MQQDKNTGTKKDFGHRMFIFGLEIILYFGIPAFGGAFLGKYLEKVYGGNGARFTVPILIFTYIFSWCLVVFRYRMIKRQTKKAREEEQ